MTGLRSKTGEIPENWHDNEDVPNPKARERYAPEVVGAIDEAIDKAARDAKAARATAKYQTDTRKPS